MSSGLRLWGLKLLGVRGFYSHTLLNIHIKYDVNHRALYRTSIGGAYIILIAVAPITARISMRYSKADTAIYQTESAQRLMQGRYCSVRHIKEGTWNFSASQQSYSLKIEPDGCSGGQHFSYRRRVPEAVCFSFHAQQY